MGLSALLAAKMAGAHPIVAVDMYQNKLLQAERCGTTHFVNAVECDPVEAILELTGGWVAIRVLQGKKSS